MSIYDNVITGQMDCQLPNPLGSTFNPTLEQYYAAGYRTRVSVDQPADGFRVTAYAPQDIDGATCKLVIVQQVNIAEEEAAAAAARLASITPQLWQDASVFRTLLRKYFGATAETDHTVTQQSVTNYFLTTTGLTGDQVRDGIFIQQLFNEIIAWTGDGTTWSFPWSNLP